VWLLLLCCGEEETGKEEFNKEEVNEKEVTSSFHAPKREE
jgi:hypothetical protein